MGPIESHEPLKVEGEGRSVSQRDVAEEASLGEMKQREVREIQSMRRPGALHGWL